MNSAELLEKLLSFYENSYDIEKPYLVNGDQYDAYASFRVTSSKYVLIKKAELWRANCFEHAFFRTFDRLETEDIQRFHAQITDVIEPDLVRKGNKYPEKDHMYSYVTGIFISQTALTEELLKAIRRLHFHKDYLLSLRGYCEAKLLVFDLENRIMVSNRAGHDLVVDYKKALKSFYKKELYSNEEGKK